MQGIIDFERQYDIVLDDYKNNLIDMFGNIKTPCNRVFYFFLGIVVNFSMKSWIAPVNRLRAILITSYSGRITPVRTAYTF